jgi:hypothetical protein
MAVFRGVVKGNTVVFEEPVDLADGTDVEVRPVVPPNDDTDQSAREDAFEQHLLEIGMIGRIPPGLPDPPGLDRSLVELEGPPLSKMIIEERR